MTSATSESEGKKIYEMEKERALVARQLNIAKGRQALTIKKLKQQGFEVLPVQTEPPSQIPPVSDSPINQDSNENTPPESLASQLGNALCGAAMAMLSAWITRLVIDYSYPRLRDLILPHARRSDQRDDVIIETTEKTPIIGQWEGQSIFK